MPNVKEIFGSVHDYIDEVIILPIGKHYNGTYSLPAGYSWTDFERIEGSMTTSTGPDGESIQYGEYSKEEIAAHPTDWVFRMQVSVGANTVATLTLTAINNFQFTIAGVGWGSERLAYLKGYRRRYATQNVSAIVNVNGGNNIGVNQRYEIDIATELGQDYVDKDLIVQAEIYNDGTNGLAGWGDSGWIYSDGVGTGYGVSANSFNDKIVVQSGGQGISADSDDVGSPFNRVGGGGWSSAPCRVKVWKIDQFITNTAGSGGGGKTTLYDGARYGNGGTVPLNDDITKYDDIRIYSAFSSSGNEFTLLPTTVEPSVLLDTTYSNTVVGFRADSANYASVHINTGTSTTTSLVVNESTSGWSNAGIYKVVGINYA